MNIVYRPLFLCASLWAALTMGCAPAYYRYSGCCVDCQYCPLPPLPYANYNECVCHSCAAQPYLNAVAAASAQPDVIEAPQPSDSHELSE